MSDDPVERINEFNDEIKPAHVLLSATRASELQRAEILRLGQVREKVANWKRQAIAGKNEDQANLYLGMECYLASLIAELKMWVLIKDEHPEEAWAALVEAQRQTTDTVRAHRVFADVETNARRLLAIEQIVFPPQNFFSAGLIVRRQICTICNRDYNECDHVVGKPYWGEFCHRRLEDVTADHVSMVDDPANKLCRVTYHGVPGGKRNTMTWRIEPLDDKEQPARDQQRALTAAMPPKR